MEERIRIVSGDRLIWEGCDSRTAGEFSKGNACGLLALLDDRSGKRDELPESISFFRDFTVHFVQEALHTDAAVFDPESIAESAPPFADSCPTSPELFSRLHQELTEYVTTHAAMEEKAPEDWLRSRLPAWADVGRVAFHLAENKNDRDGTRPFAFLATSIHGLTDRGTPKHLPLKQALANCAGDASAMLACLAPLKEASERSSFLKERIEDKSIFRPSLWSADTAWRFLKDVPLFQECGILVRMTEIWKKSRSKLRLNAGMELQRKKGQPISESLIRFSVTAAIGDRVLSPEELASIMNTKGGLIRIKGEWVEADTERIGELMRKWSAVTDFSGNTGIPFMQSLRILAGAGRLDPTQGDVPPPDELCSITPGESLREILLQSTPECWGSAGTAPAIPVGIHAVLRPYQKDGVRFLYGMTAMGLGACLADDMGLGKTLQVLTFLEILREKGTFYNAGLPALVIMPASLLENWRQEAAKFAPGLRFGILHRSFLSMEEWTAFQNDPEAFFARYDVLELSYSMASRLTELRDFEFPAVLLDEAQNIKNAAAAQSKAVRSLRAPIRIAMTGTPVENDLGDLWSLFDFIQPGLLGSGNAFREFVRSMEKCNGHSDFTPLRKLVRPYILRRLKSDKKIIRDLPDKTEVRAYCDLTPMQANLYLRCVESMKQELALADGMRRNGIVLSYLSQFKQICNHPSQFTGNQDYAFEKSGKFIRLNEIAHDIAARGEKVLVFTQYREMTGPLFDFLAQIFGRPGLLLHGGTSLAERAESVNAFQAPEGPPYFVLSLRAAGTGLNLTAASHVIHFDRWWNPAVENQATDRAYRIGQHRNVLVHKFVVKGTLEDRIDSMIAGKTWLSNSILAGGAEKALLDLSNEELLELVRLETGLREDFE